MTERNPRFDDDNFQITWPKATPCKTCIFRATLAEDGDILDAATTCTCQTYEAPDRKPDDVYWDGADCEFYEGADDKPQSLLLGLAVGDALGVPVEFRRRGTYKVTDMEGYGTHNQPPGTWSDDTSMCLELAGSLSVNKIYLDYYAKCLVYMKEHGQYSLEQPAFDIGNATNRAIERLRKGVSFEKSGGTEIGDNGNGSLMSIAPLALYLYDKKPEECYRITKQVSSVTHAHPIAVTACFIYTKFLMLLAKGRSKKAAYTELKADFAYHKKFLDAAALTNFDRILKGDIAELPETEIKSSGYVVDTLEAAFWSFLTTSNYRDAVLRAVNLGDDTDTVGAVTGAMAGLHYRMKSIPQEWLDKLVKRDEIIEVAIKMPRWDLIPSFWR